MIIDVLWGGLVPYAMDHANVGARYIQIGSSAGAHVHEPPNRPPAENVLARPDPRCRDTRSRKIRGRWARADEPEPAPGEPGRADRTRLPWLRSRLCRAGSADPEARSTKPLETALDAMLALMARAAA
jgi:hypothetical protein